MHTCFMNCRIKQVCLDTGDAVTTAFEAAASSNSMTAWNFFCPTTIH